MRERSFRHKLICEKRSWNRATYPGPSFWAYAQKLRRAGIVFMLHNYTTTRRGEKVSAADRARLMNRNNSRAIVLFGSFQLTVDYARSSAARISTRLLNSLRTFHTRVIMISNSNENYSRERRAPFSLFFSLIICDTLLFHSCQTCWRPISTRTELTIVSSMIHLLRCKIFPIQHFATSHD